MSYKIFSLVEFPTCLPNPDYAISMSIPAMLDLYCTGSSVLRVFWFLCLFLREGTNQATWCFLLIHLGGSPRCQYFSYNTNVRVPDHWSWGQLWKNICLGMNVIIAYIFPLWLIDIGPSTDSVHSFGPSWQLFLLEGPEKQVYPWHIAFPTGQYRQSF